MMSKKGVLVVVSGFSGAGKGTLMRALMNRYMNYALSVSATTRAPREGEEDGREYFFKTREEFEQLIKEDAQYVGNYYGTPKAYVEKELESGRDVILEIEIQGALKVKEKIPDALLLFVAPPSAGELKRRLVGRGTETPEVIGSRLQRAAEEAEGMERYDYLLINDELEQCVEEMHQVIQSQHHKVSENLSLIKQIGNELKVFMKGE